MKTPKLLWRMATKDGVLASLIHTLMLVYLFFLAFRAESPYLADGIVIAIYQEMHCRS